MTESRALAFVFFVVGAAGAVYGLMDLLLPTVAVTLKLRSTAKARGTNRVIGEWFQGIYRIDPTAHA